MWGNTDYSVTFRWVVAVNAIATQSTFHTEPNIGAVPAAVGDWRAAAPTMPSKLRTAALRPQDLFKLIAHSVYVVAATNDFTKGAKARLWRYRRPSCLPITTSSRASASFF